MQFAETEREKQTNETAEITAVTDEKNQTNEDKWKWNQNWLCQAQIHPIV